jgi:hypothetical protein
VSSPPRLGVRVDRLDAVTGVQLGEQVILSIRAVMGLRGRPAIRRQIRATSSPRLSAAFGAQLSPTTTRTSRRAVVATDAGRRDSRRADVIAAPRSIALLGHEDVRTMIYTPVLRRTA